MNGTIIATINEINSKFDEILTLEKFFGFVIIWIAVSIYLNELRKE